MGFSLGGAVTLKLLGEPTEGLPIVAGSQSRRRSTWWPVRRI